MAIAGIEPYDIEQTGMEIYDETQVRQILERYDELIQYVGNDDVNGFMEMGE